jgi:hypothetical protein
VRDQESDRDVKAEAGEPARPNAARQEVILARVLTVVAILLGFVSRLVEVVRRFVLSDTAVATAPLTSSIAIVPRARR